MSTMPDYSALSKKLGGGSGLFTGWVGLPDPLLAGLLSCLLFAAIAGGLGWYGVQRLKRDL